MPNDYEVILPRVKEEVVAPNGYEEISSGVKDGAHAGLSLKERQNMYQDHKIPVQKPPMSVDEESAGASDHRSSCGQSSGHSSGYTSACQFFLEPEERPSGQLEPGVQYSSIDFVEEAEKGVNLETNLPSFGDYELQPLHVNPTSLSVIDNGVNDNRRNNVSATLCHQKEDPQTLTVTLLFMVASEDEEQRSSEKSYGKTEDCCSSVEHRKEDDIDSDADEADNAYTECKLKFL